MKKSTLLTRSLGLAALAFMAPGMDALAQNADIKSKVGKGLYEIVYNSGNDAVYVAAAGSRGQNNAWIYKLDSKTLQPLDSINVSEAPGYGLGINNKTQTLYTSNTRHNSVNAINLKTGEVKTIASGVDKSHTRELVVDEKTNKVYVSDVGKPSRIWVIDGNTNTLEKFIENTGESTTGMALDSKKQVLYVTNLGTDEVATIDLKTDKIVNTFPAGAEGAVNIDFDGKTNRLFVANQTSGVLTVLDAETGNLLKSIPTGDGALGVRFDAKNGRIFVANRKAGTVTVIDSQTYDKVADLATGTYPNTVAVDAKSGNAFVANKAQSKRDEPSFVDANGDVVTLISF